MKGAPAARPGLREARGLVTAAQAQHQVERGLLLDVVVRQRAAILELLAREDEPLLVRRNTLLILNLGLHVLDGVGGLDVQGDGLASERLDENLHATAEAQDEVEGALLLDVVITESPAILKLLTSEDQALLVGR